MTETPVKNTFDEPDIFSRGSLNLTYELIRKNDAGLALVVRNISHEKPLQLGAEADRNKNSEYFRVSLDSFQVRAVVESLMMQDESDPGRAILAKVLIEDWMKLAQKMISQLPDEEKPVLH